MPLLCDDDQGAGGPFSAPERTKAPEMRRLSCADLSGRGSACVGSSSRGSSACNSRATACCRFVYWFCTGSARLRGPIWVGPVFGASLRFCTPGCLLSLLPVRKTWGALRPCRSAHCECTQCRQTPPKPHQVFPAAGGALGCQAAFKPHPGRLQRARWLPSTGNSFISPSAMISTASAARISPISRVITSMPVRPSHLAMRPEAVKATNAARPTTTP